MEATAFITQLEGMGRDDLSTVATCLRKELETVEGEITWWRATTTTATTLRARRRSREAALAAHAAVQAVQSAGARCGLVACGKDDVNVVARAAADAVRVLVADPDAAPGRGVGGAALLGPFAVLTAVA